MREEGAGLLLSWQRIGDGPGRASVANVNVGHWAYEEIILVPTAAVDPLKEQPDLKRRHAVPLVGRERELELLVETATSPPAVTLVEGEAGVGKTRLVSEALGSPALSRRRRLVGCCHSVQARFLLGPLVEALRGLGEVSGGSLNPVVGALRPLLPELASQLPPLPEPFGGRTTERHRLFRGIHEILGALGPTVLVLEDLQWADPDTVDAIEFMVTKPLSGLALLLTYRREEIEPGAPILALGARVARNASCQTISLSSLDRDQVGDLVTAILAREKVATRLVDELYAWTAGIPLAVEETVQLLRDRNQLVLRDGHWDRDERHPVVVPPALGDALRHRLALLGADAVLVAQAAAVLAAPAAEGLIGKVAGLSSSRAREALSITLASGLAQELDEGLYALRHTILRQAVYEAIPSPERRAFHLRAARILSAGRDLGSQTQVAHHFKRAGEVGLWLRSAEQAAEEASSIGDDRGAARLLQEALSTPSLSISVRARMAVKLGSAALFGREPVRAIGLLQEVVEEESLRPGIRGELRFCLARLLYQVGDSAGGYHEMVRSVGELSRRPALAARAMANLAATWPTEGGADEDRAWLDRALAAEGRQNDPVVTTQVLASRAVILLEAGDPAGWRAVEEIPWSASSTEQAVELVRACKYLAATAILLGYYPRAKTFLEKARQIRKEVGNERFGVGLATVECELDWRTGRWAGLEGRTRQLIEASAEAPIMAGRSELVRGWLLLSRGELGESQRALAAALTAFRVARPGSSLMAATAGLIKINLARKDIRAAQAMAFLGLETIRANDIWTLSQTVTPVIVEALLACRAHAEAGNVTTEFTRGLRGCDAPAGRAALAFCRGLLAEAEDRPGGAARWFAQAERAWSRLPNRYDAALARERHGRCLLAHGDKAGADLLFDALHDFETLGAKWDSARTRSLLRAHNIPLPYPWRGGRRRYESELSPREREVAELAGRGHTSPEIAQALFLSPRTVESHIASAMRKLSLASRRDLGRVSKMGRRAEEGGESKLP